jgi:hypothetical protein
LPLPLIKAILKELAERTNYGLHDPPVRPDDEDDEEDDEDNLDAEERDLPKEFDKVPAGLKAWRWEVKNRAKVFGSLPSELRDKIDARAQERATVRPLQHFPLTFFLEEGR